MRRLIVPTLCFLVFVGCRKKTEPSLAPAADDPATPLVSTLKEGTQAERLVAMRTLAAMGQQARPAVTELERLANDSDETVRHEAATTLQAIAPESAKGRSGITLVRLKQVGQAMHQYLEVHKGSFPPTCTVMTPMDGKQPPRPGLSWRVLLLPYLDQKELFAQFKLNEAWDSEHNKKLIDQMPAIYAPPGGSPTETKPGETHVQVFCHATSFFGQGATIFPHPALIVWRKASACRISAVTDGLSNTFLVVEASRPAIWTKPDDVVVSDAPLPELGHAVDGVFHVLLADGSVHQFSRRANAYHLRTAIGLADGNPSDFESMMPHRAPPAPTETARVLGRVMTRGTPLVTGWVVLHDNDGREYGGQLGVDGSYLATGVPFGRFRATIAVGDPFAAWMAKPDSVLNFVLRLPVQDKYLRRETSPLVVDVKANTTEVDLAIE